MVFKDFIQDVTSKRNAAIPLVVIRETAEGYDVRTEAPVSDRAILIERVSAITGFAMIALAVTGIYVAKTNALPGLSAAQMAAAATLLTGGIAFLWIAVRGTRHQVNFDLEKRQIHYATRNLIDSSRILRTIDLDDIEGAFIERPADAGKPARLYVRLGTDDTLFEVARGREAQLRELRDRMSHDLPTLARTMLTTGPDRAAPITAPA